MRDQFNKYELILKVRGNPVKEYFHDGLVFVEGRPGSEYTLEIRNNTHERIAAIVSVDGLSVIDGNPAGTESKSFILNGYGRQEVHGWVKSLSAVNKFEFASPDRSYSNRTNQGTKNLGVIGLMVFTEKPYVPINFNPQPVFRSWKKSAEVNNLEVFGSVSNMSARSAPSIGTGHGDEKKVSMSEVKFQRRDPSNPDGILAMYYDDRKGLERRGIIVDTGSAFPNAFPSYTSENKFCKTPTR